MYQALYRSFRPESFDTFLGQEHIVRILKNQIHSGSTGHAYLFCGTRGTGKTTTARLLAKALNCTSDGERPCGECENCKAIAAGNFLDVVEIDAASNNGVDDIRELRESVNFPPVVGRTKVYIIDEAHMLSGAASNALLKTLEEPPENVVFILATTEPNKLPATILSRCLRMDFRRIPEKLLIERFSEICLKLNVEASPDALSLIAANADGSVRDGLSLLDRCISGAKTLSRDDVLFLLGMAGMDSFIRMTDCVSRGDAGGALTELASVLAEGRESVQFARDWLEHLRNLIIIKYTKKPENVLNLSIENIERLRKQSSEIAMNQLRLWITELSKALADAKWSPRPRILVELAIIRMACVNEVPAERPAPAPKPAPFSRTQTAAPTAKKSSAADALAMLKKASAADDGLDDLPPDDAFFPEGIEEIPEDAAPSPFGKCEEMSEEEKASLATSFGDENPTLTQDDLDNELWMEVLHDPGMPIQLQMSGAELCSMNDEEFTIRVSNPIIADRFAAHGSRLEELMTIRSGKHRKMTIISVES